MEGIADLIQCSICLETFTDPRMLPCIHTFCLKCLQQAELKKDEQQPREKLQCSICGMEFIIPQQGVEGFQENFFMNRLIEITAITQPLEKSCDMCLASKEQDEDEVSQAGVYCLQCCKNICRSCSKIHNNITKLKHQLFPLGTEISVNMIKTISHQNCPQHNSEQAKMYCSDCKEAICVICFVENHESHSCSGVEKVGNASRQELKESVSQVEICFNEQLAIKQQCTDDKTNFQTNMENIEQKIISRKNELIALIDQCAKSLLDELASMQQKRLKDIQNEMNENDRQLVIIESFNAYCKHVEANANNVELCQIVPTLKHRAEEIQQTHRTLCRQLPVFNQVFFEKTNFEEISKTENAIGRLNLSNPENPLWQTKDFIRSSGKLAIPFSYVVYGLTKLANKICVLCREPNVIRIFRDESLFDLQMEIDIKQIDIPLEIGSDEKSKCLYVSKLNSNCIWKITIDDCQVTEWLTDAGGAQGSLSLTSDGHVLLDIYSQPTQLGMFSSNAELIREFSLPNEILYPQHIIRKANGEFIISHREGYEKGPWVISRLTSDGQTVIARFKPSDKTQESDEHRHFALDSDNDRLFVADYRNDRVILIDSNSLTLLAILLTKSENGISQPFRLFYDGKKKQLIVLQFPNEVDVYEMI